MPKRAFYFLVISVSLFLIISTAGSIFKLGQAAKRVDLKDQEVAKLRQENQKLKGDLEKIKTQEFIEKMAREKLNLARPDETLVIIPPELLTPANPATPDTTPNYLKWWRLWF